VVLAAFTLMFLGFGAAYAFAAFFTALQADFGASRAQVSLVFSLCALLWFSVGAPAGLAADRFGPRGVCLAGALCLAAGLALAANAASLGTLYVTYSLAVGIGIGLTYVPSVAAVQQAFTQHRALSAITGSLYTAAGIGTLIGPTFAGASFDAFGSYDVSILACAALCFAGAGIAVAQRRHLVHRA